MGNYNDHGELCEVPAVKGRLYKAGHKLYLENPVLLAEGVEQGVHCVEHGDHLQGCDVTADASEAHHITEEDGHIREHLGNQRAGELAT